VSLTVINSSETSYKLKFLHPTRQKIGHLEEVLPGQYLGMELEKATTRQKPNNNKVTCART